MPKLWTTLSRCVDVALIGAFLIMVGAVSLNVVFRYFGYAFDWADEVAELAFVWMALLAAAEGVRLKLHPGFDVLVERASPAGARRLALLINLLVLLFEGFLLVGGIKYIAIVHVQKTAILGISVAWMYAAVPVAVALMIVATLRTLVDHWRRTPAARLEQPGTGVS